MKDPNREQGITTIALVACSKSKHLHRLPAKHMYSSALFAKTMRYSQRNYDEWYILSAKYGLVDPDTELDPYDDSLKSKSVAERKLWADKTFRQLLSVLPPPTECALFFHAGDTYRKLLANKLVEAGYHCEVPLERLGIGKQLAWYNTH